METLASSNKKWYFTFNGTRGIKTKNVHFSKNKNKKTTTNGCVALLKCQIRLGNRARVPYLVATTTTITASICLHKYVRVVLRYVVIFCCCFFVFFLQFLLLHSRKFQKKYKKKIFHSYEIPNIPMQPANLQHYIVVVVVVDCQCLF